MLPHCLDRFSCHLRWRTVSATFASKTFCLTGRFVFGESFECEETIFEMRGSVVN
ncbi:MAG: hypothetical protein U5O39_15045 [Gammaproteobacteria bacterium]|nr:hypothetical protein [Gammaproteobacteria bacterium]